MLDHDEFAEVYTHLWAAAMGSEGQQSQRVNKVNFSGWQSNASICGTVMLHETL
jgi:hypothetical protein